MRAIDFEYDNKRLSDFGYVVCDFNFNGGTAYAESGANIIFGKVAHNGGKRYSLTSTRYDKCATATIDICKDPDTHDDLTITDSEYALIARWLNRREFLKLRLIDDCDKDSDRLIYFYTSFNISKVYSAGQLCGIRAVAETNSPFGYAAEVTENIVFNSPDDIVTVIDESDEIGYRYPDLKITMRGSGKLILSNVTLGTETVIDGCTSGEVITILGWPHAIYTSAESHKIANQFNYEFFRIGNQFCARENEIKASLPCDIEMTYAPTVYDIF